MKRILKKSAVFFAALLLCICLLAGCAKEGQTSSTATPAPTAPNKAPRPRPWARMIIWETESSGWKEKRMNFPILLPAQPSVFIIGGITAPKGGRGLFERRLVDSTEAPFIGSLRTNTI